MTINVVNIGCFKNLVDCERLIWQLQAAGATVGFGESDTPADVAIINTCGFISDAERDSSALIRRYAERKRSGAVGSLWVMGCYGQKRGDALRDDVPEVDRVYGNFDWHSIVADLLATPWTDSGERTLTTPRHYAYIKIAEGCSQACAYCIKPIINGPLRSEPMEKIVDECTRLAAAGVKELQIVAQNTTAYGLDLYRRPMIAELLERLADIDGIEWIRLHYAYPLNLPKPLIDVIASRTNICNYIDMALQHCNEELLRLMRRPMAKSRLLALLDSLRERGIAIRTTVMTGHPGETEEAYQELREFVATQRFDRLGVFAYSHEPLSYAATHYADTIPEAVKRARALELMELQRHIYDDANRRLVGNTLRVIVDGRNAEGDYLGRPANSTPMADPKVIIKTAATLTPGTFVAPLITRSLGKDMEGTL